MGPVGLQPWLDVRTEFPIGPLFCVVTGPTRGRGWSTTAVHAQLRMSRPKRAFGAASLRISFATRTRWR